MRRAIWPIHLLLCVALIWQGAAGAVAAGRMSGFHAAFGGALCRPGGGDPRAADPQAIFDQALCAAHCGAAAAPPAPPALPAPLVFTLARRDAAALSDAPGERRSLPPPARGPPLSS